MMRDFFAGTLVLACLGASRETRAEDSITIEAMRQAIEKFRTESYVLGGLTLAGGIAGSLTGTIILFFPEYKNRRRPGFPLFAFGQLQSFAGTWVLASGIGESSHDDLLELSTPADYQRLALPGKLRDARVLQIGLIADLVVTGLSLPLLFPVDRFKDWFGMGVLMVVEGVFSVATAFAYQQSLGAFISSIERYGKFVGPPMGPQVAQPIMFDVKFAF